MSISFELSRTALVLCDFDNDVVHPEGKFTAWGLPAEVARRHVLLNSKRLLTAARRAGLHVVHVTGVTRPGLGGSPKNAAAWQALAQMGALLEGTWGAQIHDELKPEAGEMVVVKRRVSAFYHSDLQIVLSDLRADTLILCGVATNFVVEGTARDAADAGFVVIVAEDCCSTVSEEVHKASLAAMAMLTTVTTSAEIMATLEARAGHRAD
jgi:nicotinamidase-related amidase